MIATLKGIISEKDIDAVIIDVNGVGYGVAISSDDHAVLKKGESAKLHVYEHIREQSHELFGFTSMQSKNFFEQLLGVNGVGPKMAVKLLSLGSVDSLANAIANEDAAYVKQASGVGKRVAERIVVELKDKVGDGGSYVSTGQVSTQDEAVQGLTALGYTKQDAANALAGIDEKLSTEERIKEALKGQK
ncbi:MAG: Holliday junction branch migration protein RuvA [bacterium]|nr:Holliday junction branch migration protein RuvA [bacterium]